MIRVVFFGTETISAPTLSALINSPKYSVVAVVTKPDSPRGRGRRMSSPAVAKLATANQITCLQPVKLVDVTKEIIALHPDVGALVAYGKIIPQAIIDLFPHGIINFHPSMLPVYRGPSPIETALIDGVSLTGLSLMELTKDMDSGDIYYQERAPIGPNDTATDLYSRFGQTGSTLMTAKLAEIVAGKLKKVPQDDNFATYCHMLTKQDGQLNPQTMTARECYNRLRALSVWPKCRINLAGTEVIVTKAKPLDNFSGDDWPDVITCRDDSALQLVEIVAPKSGRRMKVGDYLNGLK